MKVLFSCVAAILLAAAPAFAQSLPTSLGSVGDAASALAGSEAANALSVENFDPATVNALIDGSSLDDATKATLKDGVAKAAENPELVQGVIDQIKAALGA